MSGAVRDGGLMLCAAIMMMTPAIVWGRPFVFGDTPFYWSWGGDILEALQRPWPQPGQPWELGRSVHGWGASTHDMSSADLRFNLTWLTARSAYYAVPFHLLVRAGGLWLVAGLQALVAAWVVRVAFSAAAPACTGLIYLGSVAVLAATSSLGFETAYMMPDLFGGLAVLAAAVLLVYRDRIGRTARLGLIGLVICAVLVHAENGLNVAAAVLIGWIWYWRSGADWRAAIGRTAPIAIALVIGLVMATGGQMILAAAFGRPVHMAPFAASRVLADGGAQRYLRETCSRFRMAACDLANRPPVDIEYYLWVYPLEDSAPTHTSDRARYTLAQFDRLERRHVTDAQADQREQFVAEQTRLVLGALQTDGVQQAREAFINGAVAFINFGVDRSFDSVAVIVRGGRTLMRDQTLSILPGGVGCVRPKGQACGYYDLAWVAPLEYAAVLMAFGFLGVCSFYRTLAPTRDLADFLLLTLGLVLANAFLCGAISGPYSRYQARVEWLIPMGALLLIAQWVQRAALARSCEDAANFAACTATSA
jgi:hypothetical protein